MLLKEADLLIQWIILISKLTIGILLYVAFRIGLSHVELSKI